MRFTLWLLGVGLAAGVQASGHLASSGEFLGCRDVEPESNRLECYDAVADRLQAPPQVAEAPQAPEVPEVSSTDPEDLFGKSAEAVEVDKEVDEVVARVTRAVKDGRGRLVLVLDNQQRWRQVSSERFQIEVGDEVVIRKAALSSFTLQKRSGGRKTKVRRQD